MDGNWQPYSIRFIFQILLRAVAKQKYGYPILWTFLGFTIEDIASSRQAPTFHEHNLAVIAENWKVSRNLFSKNCTGSGNRRCVYSRRCSVVPLKTTPKPISTHFGTHCKFSRSHWFDHLSLIGSLRRSECTGYAQYAIWRSWGISWTPSMKLAKQPCMRVFLGVLVDSLLKGFWTCTSQFVPWVLQKKKTHFRNTSWLLQKSSKEKMTSKEMLMKSWPSHDIFLTHVTWKSMTIQETCLYVIVSYDGGSTIPNCQNLWQVTQELCGSEGSPTLTFWVFIHLQRILQTHQEWWRLNRLPFEKFGTTGMKGPRRCLSAYLRFLLISNMIVDLCMFLVWWQRNILGTTRKTNTFGILWRQECQAGSVRLPFRSFFQSTGPVESFGATVQWRK